MDAVKVIYEPIGRQKRRYLASDEKNHPEDVIVVSVIARILQFGCKVRYEVADVITCRLKNGLNRTDRTPAGGLDGNGIRPLPLLPKAITLSRTHQLFESSYWWTPLPSIKEDG